jgi:hypothetical protein
MVWFEVLFQGRVEPTGAGEVGTMMVETSGDDELGGCRRFGCASINGGLKSAIV